MRVTIVFIHHQHPDHCGLDQTINENRTSTAFLSSIAQFHTLVVISLTGYGTSRSAALWILSSKTDDVCTISHAVTNPNGWSSQFPGNNTVSEIFGRCHILLIYARLTRLRCGDTNFVYFKPGRFVDQNRAGGSGTRSNIRAGEYLQKCLVLGNTSTPTPSTLYTQLLGTNSNIALSY